MRAFTISDPPQVCVRVKGIDRLAIPGSFVVQLLADGKPIGKRAFYQTSTPRESTNAAEPARVKVDFRVAMEMVENSNLSVRIEVPAHEPIGAAFPLSRAGDPVVSVRLMLAEG